MNHWKFLSSICLCVAVAVSGCGGDTTPGGGGTPMRVCASGEARGCTCNTGASGAQSCLPDGSGFAACVCATVDAGVPPTDTVTRSCEPNATRSCACPGGVSGAQTCNAGGTGFGMCTCPMPPVDAGTRVCTPNTTQSCACAGGVAGAQTCNAEGSAFNACMCPMPDAGTRVCMPNTTQPCTCVGGASGTQTCNADGSAFNACMCPMPDAGTRVCTPGSARLCPCLGGANGSQTCLGDGSGFALCICPVPDAGTQQGAGDSGTGALDFTMVATGRRCTSDINCAAGQTCQTLGQGRICTNETTCEQGSRAEEESQCGGRGSTCLLLGATATQRIDVCVRGCVPSATSERLGACGAGFVCTTNWLRQPMGAMESAAGCLPHCTQDSHCAGVVLGDAGAMRCNVRTGFCGASGSDFSLRRDGDPCNPMVMTPQCRGICFSLSATNRTQGLCGSFINLSTTQQCPDYDQETMSPRVPQGDNLGVCIFRNCDSNAQCSAGLVCVFPEDATGMVRSDLPSSCGYPTTRQPNGISATDGGLRRDF